MQRQISNKKNGFTLLELVVAMSITSVLSLVVFSGVSAVLQGLNYASSGISLMSDISLFTTLYERDVKSISINNANSQYIPQINSYSATSFSFDDASGSTIVYSISGNDILRNGSNMLHSEIDPAQTRFSFFGYTAAGAQIDAVAAGLPANQVRLVKFEFVITKPTQDYRIEQTFALNYR